ncbi:MAG: hypothetical protein HY911_07725 [Desulfobacterales bacterium]|nr:hypothetical protein [Desulfobacterales bacterium]
MDDPQTVRALPGSRHAVNGTLTTTVSSLNELSYRSANKGLRLLFIDLRGRIWRGELHVGDSVSPGSYELQVFDSRQPGVEMPVAHHVLVFDSASALNASYPSICRKAIGIPPWWLVIASLLPLIGALLLSYLHSARNEALLERQGIFPILKLSRLKDRWEVGIGVHGEQKIFAGDLLRLLNARLEPVGELRIISVRDAMAHAAIELSADIAPGYFVQKPPGSSASGFKV